MEAWDAITSRRQVRSFTADPVPDDVLDRILEAGRRAPSGSNTQRWALVVVRERDQLRRLAGVWQGAAWIPSSAATIAVVVPSASEPRSQLMTRFDAGQLTMQVMIAAAGLGVASGQAACADQDLARDILGFPDGHECVGLIALGFPADRPLQPIIRPNRRPFDEVVHFDRWDGDE